MFELLASFAAAAALFSAAIALMGLAISKVGKTQGNGMLVWVVGPLLANLVLITLGIKILAAQHWFRPAAAAVGVAVPLIVLAVLKGSNGSIAS
jgi:fumarate reductase subunit C